MKREDVSKIIPGITPEQLDSIMNLHGADITAKANEITTLKAEKTTLTEQLNTANGKLEGMSTKLDVFYAASKLTDDEYKELTELLAEKEAQNAQNNS